MTRSTHACWNIPGIKSLGVVVLLCSFILPTRLHADPIIFSEIMYHPQDDQEPAWVEITNLTSTPFDCAEWTLAGSELLYTFPAFDLHNPRDSFIKPFEQCILTESDPETFRQLHGIAPDMRIFGPWQGDMDQKKEHLKLSDKNGIVLTEIQFDNDPPWPIEAAGAGYSMVVRHPDHTINDWRNWTASNHPGGTPGSIPFPENGILYHIPSDDGAWTQRTILPMDASWRYQPGLPDLNPEWPSLSFDDSQWASGKALLGFEEAPLPNPGLQTPLNAGPMTYCFRTQFHIDDLDSLERLVIHHILDDGVLYYINGVKIGSVRFSGPGGITSFDTPALETVTNATIERDALVIDPKLLFHGTNVLAAEVHQINPTSTDLVFGAELTGQHRKVTLPFRLTEIGITLDGQGYAKVENTTEEPIKLDDYWLVASGSPSESPQVIAAPENMTLTPGTIQTIPFDQAISPHARVGWTHKRNSGQPSELPLALPGKGYRQLLKDSARNTWKVERISVTAQNNPIAATKGQILINEMWRRSPESLDIELFNSTQQTFQLETLSLSLHANFKDPFHLQGSLEPMTFTSFKLTVHEIEDLTLRVFLFNHDTSELIDAQRQTIPLSGSVQRFPDGDDVWFHANTDTIGKPNQIQRTEDVVINEIMYDPPFGQPDLEFIELYNRGSQEVDLSGWQLKDGAAYDMPQGTIMPPETFIVVADKPEVFHALYPDLQALGPLKGKLNNDGERIQLLDAKGNLADVVDYQAEGDWPSLARGKGSSMELSNPHIDNAQSSAWKDSRESRASTFKHFSFTKRYFGHREIWDPMDFRELHFYLVGESHVVLQNIQLREKGSSENLIKHPDRLSIEGDSSTGWLIQGNHADSFVENGRLHLISHGHGDNRANRAEIDVTDLKRGTDYILEFEARWVQGSPRLIARTWENSFSESILLPVPARIGTPGKQNSRWQAHPPALVEDLQQHPAVPSPGEPLLIQAKVGWHHQSGNVHLVYRVDESSQSDWTRIPMSPSHEAAGHSTSLTTYEVLLENNFPQGELIQYYVEATLPQSPRTTLPRGAAAAPALCVFDGRPIPSDLRVIRLLISNHHLKAIYRGESPEYLFRYPRLSNQYFNATFISNERDIYTGAVLRASGSPWTRQNSMDRGKWKLPKDRTFRDHGKFSFDNDPTRNRGAYRHHNRIARYLLYLLGHVSGENEFVYVIINAGAIQVREEVEPVDSDYLNRNFEDGNKGELYRIDDDWWMSDHWSQSNLDASWNDFGDHPALYRHSWMKRSGEEEDDYTALIDFIQLINRPDYSQAEVEAVLDSEAVLKMTAVLGFIADWDTFTQSRGKNAYFYRRPSDHRFQFLQWDADLSFGVRRYNGFFGGSRQFVDWIKQPYNFPRLTDYLDQLVDWTRDQNSRVEAWMFEESQGNPYTRIHHPFYRSFFQERRNDVERLKSR